MAKNEIRFELNKKEFREAMETFKKMDESIDDKYLKSTLRRKVKPMETEMKIMSPSTRISQVIGISTSKKRTGGGVGVYVGVTKNIPSIFKDISSYALASILEYGTPQRFRESKLGKIITGRISTGKVDSDPYLRPAYDRNLRSLISDMESTITKRVKKASNK